MKKTLADIAAETAKAYREAKQKDLYNGIIERIKQRSELGYISFTVTHDSWFNQGHITVGSFYTEHGRPHKELYNVVGSLRENGFSVDFNTDTGIDVITISW